MLFLIMEFVIIQFPVSQLYIALPGFPFRRYVLKPLLSSIVLFIVKLPAFPIAPPTDFEPDYVIVLFK